MAPISTPVALPPPVATRYFGPYRFVKGPLVSRPAGSTGSPSDSVDVFLHMNRALPLGRVDVTVDGISPLMTAGGTGLDQIDGPTNATATCYEVSIDDKDAGRFQLGQVVSVVVTIVSHAADENGMPLVGASATAQARVSLGRDSFPPGDPDAFHSPFGYPLLGCPPS